MVREKMAQKCTDVFLLTENGLAHSESASVAQCRLQLLYSPSADREKGYSTVDVPRGDYFDSITVRFSHPALLLLTVVRGISTHADQRKKIAYRIF